MKNKQREREEMMRVSPPLLGELRGMIEESRRSLAGAVNASMTMLYWRIGTRINQEILQGDRAEYGKQIVASVSQQLSGEYGQGFSYSALTRMVKFSEVLPDVKIVATLSQQLSWSHFCEIIPLEQSLQRDFYAEMCRVEHWSAQVPARSGSELLKEGE